MICYYVCWNYYKNENRAKLYKRKPITKIFLYKHIFIAIHPPQTYICKHIYLYTYVYTIYTVLYSQPKRIANYLIRALSCAKISPLCTTWRSVAAAFSHIQPTRGLIKTAPTTATIWYTTTPKAQNCRRCHHNNGSFLHFPQKKPLFSLI